MYFVMALKCNIVNNDTSPCFEKIFNLSVYNFDIQKHIDEIYVHEKIHLILRTWKIIVHVYANFCKKIQSKHELNE